jgi:hypothetical protein
VRAVAIVALLVACGGHPHPAQPPAFDAEKLAAEVEGVMGKLADATARAQDDCPRLLDELDAILAGARPTFDRVHAAEQDPEHARQLTAAMRPYQDQHRSTDIAAALAVCFRTHRELQDRVQHVVDSMPTL